MYLRSFSIFLFTFSALLHFISTMTKKPGYALNIVADVFFFIGSICIFVWTALYATATNLILLGIILAMGNGMQFLITHEIIQHVKECRAWEAECELWRKRWENL